MVDSEVREAARLYLVHSSACKGGCRSAYLSDLNRCPAGRDLWQEVEIQAENARVGWKVGWLRLPH